jgi:CIC family chloride channel protein
MLNHVRGKMFDPELLDTTFVVDYFMQAPAVIDDNDSFARIMKVFDDTQAWNLPVIKDGKFAGIISKSKLYSEYRKLLAQLSDE